ncbi:MAG: CpsD/CapB family tyrosine-protein kinase [Clostridia bacterium]|nr:CpsD/CapB family tyrosine-protein kinase [Clostridia bacterium]
MSLFKRKHKASSRRERIIVTEGAARFGSYGYTRLRDNLLYISADGNRKVLQIESALAKEGKTTVTANLAVSLGLTNKKVVVVDLDFRRPRLHRVFGLARENGIAEYMVNTIDRDGIIKHTTYKNVDLVTRGGTVYNPALILVSEKFKELIAYLREKYDFVLLDCAPVLQVSDYIHISKVSDGALFLVSYGKTTKAQVADAVKELNKNDIPVLGTLFTMYDRKKDARYGYSYGGYYGKYYDEAYGDMKKATVADIEEVDEIGTKK